MTLAQVGNAVFNVIPAKIALTATRTGALRVGPVTVSLDLLVPSNDRGPIPLDPFGMMRRSVEKPLSVATDALDVKAQPLPSKNVPPDFNGVVGNYTMTVSADKRDRRRSSLCVCRYPAAVLSTRSRCRRRMHGRISKRIRPRRSWRRATNSASKARKRSSRSFHRKTPACMNCRH
jgi:hypothetical protein